MGTLICLPGDRASGGPRQDLNPGSLNSEHVSLTLIGENRFVCVHEVSIMAFNVTTRNVDVCQGPRPQRAGFITS